MNNLPYQAMLVSLTIQLPSFVKTEKSVSNQVDHIYSAHNAGIFRKTLINKSYLNDITMTLNKIRVYHYSQTLPWLTQQRIIPSNMILDYTTEINRLKADFNKAKDIFVQQMYLAAIEAAKDQLGDLFNPADYPSSQTLSDLFQVKVVFMPVPNRYDFRVSLPIAIISDMRDEYERNMEEWQNGIHLKLVDRLLIEAKHIYDITKKDTSKIFPALFSKAVDQAKLVNDLNLANNNTVSCAAHTVIAKFEDVDINKVRKDPEYRALQNRQADKLVAYLQLLKNAL